MVLFFPLMPCQVHSSFRWHRTAFRQNGRPSSSEKFLRTCIPTGLAFTIAIRSFRLRSIWRWTTSECKYCEHLFKHQRRMHSANGSWGQSDGSAWTISSRSMNGACGWPLKNSLLITTEHALIPH